MSTNSGDNKEKSLKPKKYWRVPEFFPELSKEQQEKLLAYQTELIHFNGRINLISARTEQEADIIHMADCIKASQLILKVSQQKEIFDIGSGNGLPGIVMAILDAERKIVVVDKDARKMEFLKHLCSRLALKNVDYMHARVEDLSEGTVHCAVSRGFASITKSIMAMRKACAKDAEYYHMKSDSWVREIAQIPSQICAYWEPSLVGEYQLPVAGVKYSVVLTKKIS